MEFLARCVQKVHSNCYLKNALKQEPGLLFLDIICPSDIAYVICLIENSSGVWLDALRKDRNNEEHQGNKKKPKAKYTAGKGKKQVIGECMWNDNGQQFYSYAIDKWSEVCDPEDPQYEMLHGGWELWVSTKAQTMVLGGSWTKKTIKSVLATRTGGGVQCKRH